LAVFAKPLPLKPALLLSTVPSTPQKPLLFSSMINVVLLPPVLEELDELDDDEVLEFDELLDDELVDEELLDEELLDDELEELLELFEPPVAVNAASVGVPVPFAQNPKLTDAPGATFWFHESGVTTLPFRLPFHKLVICVPAGSSVTDQLVTATVPVFAISTWAQ
jgi:hypothetical protein